MYCIQQPQKGKKNSHLIAKPSLCPQTGCLSIKFQKGIDLKLTSKVILNVSEKFSCLLCGRYRPQNPPPDHHMVRRGLPNYLVYQYFPFGTIRGAPESESFITMQLFRAFQQHP